MPTKKPEISIEVLRLLTGISTIDTTHTTDTGLKSIVTCARAALYKVLDTYTTEDEE